MSAKNSASIEERSQLALRQPSSGPPIVYFDGVCGLCNHTVNWLLEHDINQKLRFAPLQGETARQSIPHEIREHLSTLVFQKDGQTHVRSGAVSRILLTLGGKWWLAGMLLWLIPRPIRDTGYRIVSMVRYRLFGKHDACRLPKPGERAVFLD